jgi:hypothetical protein
MTDEKSNPENEVPRPEGTSPEIVPVTEDLYTDMTLEELEQRLELQALLDGDLGAEACYIEVETTECGTKGTTIITTVVTRPPDPT